MTVIKRGSKYNSPIVKQPQNTQRAPRTINRSQLSRPAVSREQLVTTELNRRDTASQNFQNFSSPTVNPNQSTQNSSGVESFFKDFKSWVPKGLNIRKILNGDQKELQRLGSGIAQGIAQQYLPQGIQQWMPKNVNYGQLATGDKTQQQQILNHMLNRGANSLQNQLPQGIQQFMPQNTNYGQLLQGNKAEQNKAIQSILNRGSQQLAQQLPPAVKQWLPQDLNVGKLLQGDQGEQNKLLNHVANQGGQQLAGTLPPQVRGWIPQDTNFSNLLQGNKADQQKLLSSLANRGAQQIIGGLPPKAQAWVPQNIDYAKLAKGDKAEQQKFVTQLASNAVSKGLPNDVKQWLPQDVDYGKLLQGDKAESKRFGEQVVNKAANHMLAQTGGLNLPKDVNWAKAIQGDADEIGKAASGYLNQMIADKGITGAKAGYNNGNLNLDWGGAASKSGKSGNRAVSFQPYGQKGKTLWESKRSKKFGTVNIQGHNEVLGDYYLRGGSEAGAGARTYIDKGKNHASVGVEAFAGVQGEYRFGNKKVDGNTTIESNGRVWGQAGVTARAEAGVDWGGGNYGAKVGVEAFAGASIGIEGRTDVTVDGYHVGDVHGKATAHAGAGVSAGVDVGYKDGKFRLGANLGFAWGLGASANMGVTVDLKSLEKMAKKESPVAAALAVEELAYQATIKQPLTQTKGMLDKGAEKVEKALGPAGKPLAAARKIAGKVFDAHMDAIDSVRKTVSKSLKKPAKKLKKFFKSLF